MAMELRNDSVSVSLNPVATETVAGSRAAQSYWRVDARQTQGDHTGETSALDPDWATLSTAGSRTAQSASEDSVREDKVATVRAALSAGTYAVPAAQVASRTIGAMLGLSV
jgi:anti-sigma28 factor (negative regulator of flagellin synthesis)